MREWLEKKWVQAILIIVILFVWGYNMYNIADIASSKEKEKGVIMSSKLNANNLSMPDIKEYNYKSDFKDPFRPDLNQKSIVQQKTNNTLSSAPVQERSRPQLNLTGIVEAMALIQNTNQKLFFVTVGDIIEGARVYRITEDSVVLVFESEQFTLKVNN